MPLFGPSQYSRQTNDSFAMLHVNTPCFMFNQPQIGSNYVGKIHLLLFDRQSMYPQECHKLSMFDHRLCTLLKNICSILVQEEKPRKMKLTIFTVHVSR